MTIIIKHDFSDPSIDRVECDVIPQVLIHLNNNYDSEHLWLVKADIISLAKTVGVTANDLTTKGE